MIYGNKVETGILNVRVKDGVIKSMNGSLIETVKPSNITSPNEQESLAKVLAHVGAEHYKWEDEKEENWLKISTKNRYATFYPKGELVWVSKEFNRDNPLELAYKFEVYAKKPLSNSIYYVAIETGEILAKNDIIHHVDAVGSGVTGYSGTQTITTDLNNGTYRLRENGRGNGVETYDMQNGLDYSNAIDFTNITNNWNTGTAQDYLFALDAHWGSEMVYDYFLTQHNRNSIDDNGFKLMSYVHYDVNYGNAFWDGYRMTYGDGSSGNSPYTTLDIVAHEITHGLTTNTAGLIYSYESGALNESFSDIFGASTEWFAKPNQANWFIGDETGNSFRSMSNPNSKGHPDTYLGNNWETTSYDNGGVHINSSVQNYWFYLLVNGGSGTNDNGDSYSVSPIGQTKAAKIAYRNLTNYLVNSSDFFEARFYSIQSAMDLYGVCSPEVEAVTKAWYAVGVGDMYTSGVSANFTSNTVTGCEVPFTVSFQNLSVNGTSYTWDFGDGTTATGTFPEHTYTAVGTYTVSLLADGGACGSDQEVKATFITIDTSIPCTDMIANSTVSRSNCQGELYDSGGQAGNYTSNENSYAIISPNSGLPFDLNIDFIDIEENSTCSYDYLSIYDGIDNTGNIIAVICNNSNYNSVLTSTSGSFFLHFHSDVYVEGGGFKVSWDCNNSSSIVSDNNCSGQRTDSGGENGNYDNNEVSIVVLEPTGASQIDLQFDHFDIEGHVSCYFDYLEVYDGNSVYAPLIGRYCNGNPPPSVILSSGGTLTIKFYSDISVTNSGFVYSWSCVTEGSVAINEAHNTEYKIYPNPSNGIFHLSTDDNSLKVIQVKDLLGKIVYTDNSYRNDYEINLSNLAKGTYIFAIYVDDNIVNYKKIILK